MSASKKVPLILGHDIVLPTSINPGQLAHLHTDPKILSTIRKKETFTEGNGTPPITPAID
jgi:hypothetical protein